MLLNYCLTNVKEFQCLTGQENEASAIWKGSNLSCALPWISFSSISGPKILFCHFSLKNTAFPIFANFAFSNVVYEYKANVSCRTGVPNFSSEPGPIYFINPAFLRHWRAVTSAERAVGLAGKTGFLKQFF